MTADRPSAGGCGRRPLLAAGLWTAVHSDVSTDGHRPVLPDHRPPVAAAELGAGGRVLR
ncbi:hypothetical protein [Quadrisphaera sp. INWT6]|uniref:hypothetical protein n=1 Tax=Quadrisphaera sp. INWT6 TaxID=2596917 RepID=UPI0018926476|nr:hypothetical protein [Quadrisphaera sp. INWT6]